MHHILSLKLHSSTFNIVSISEGARKIPVKNVSSVACESSILDAYVDRRNLKSYQKKK